MDIYEYFNSKTIERYWRDKRIEPTTWDMLRIVYASYKTWAEKRAALFEIMREREQEAFPEELKEWIEDKIEWYSEMETKQKELIFLKTRDTSSISAYVRQFIERMDEIEKIKEKDGEGGFSSESFHTLWDKYGAATLFFFLPITKNMQKHPFETGDILLEDSDYLVLADGDEVYKIYNGEVELTSDWNPWDCELVKTIAWNNEYGGCYDDTTDGFEDCPNTLRLISDYLVDSGGWNLSDLLNNWNWALEQDFPQNKDETPTEE